MDTPLPSRRVLPTIRCLTDTYASGWLSSAVEKSGLRSPLQRIRRVFTHPSCQDLKWLVRCTRWTRAYLTTLEAASRTTRLDSDWRCYPILETQKLRCGLFRLEPGKRIPLHDHEGLRGTLMVIEGVVVVERYKLLVRNDLRVGMARLRKLPDEELAADANSDVDGTLGDIHSLLNPTPSPSYFLDAIWHGGREQKRHFYFPTRTHQDSEGDVIEAVAVQEHHLERMRAAHPSPGGA